MGSLTEFLKTHRPYRRKYCYICTHPHRNEIDAALREGMAPSVILLWLKDEGYAEATKPNVDYHKYSLHHLEGVRSKRSPKKNQ